MSVDPVAAYVSREDPLEITINFGLFAGREVSREEVDQLAESLLRVVGGFTAFVGRRYEFAEATAEVANYEVRLEFPSFVLPEQPPDEGPVIEELVETITLWARSCALTAPVEEDLHDRIARELATDATATGAEAPPPS